MVSEESVRARISPETEKPVAATLAEDDGAVDALVVPRAQGILLSAERRGWSASPGAVASAIRFVRR